MAIIGCLITLSIVTRLLVYGSISALHNKHKFLVSMDNEQYKLCYYNSRLKFANRK